MELLSFSDGTTTVHIDGSDGYHLLYGRWSPAVSGMSAPGENKPFGKVQESMTLRLTGTAAASKADRLARLMEQAQRFANGENVSPVVLSYQVAVDDTIWRDLVLGMPRGQRAINLPPNFDAVTDDDALMPVGLTFWRANGQWLRDPIAVDDDAADAAVTNGDVAELVFAGGDLAIKSPTKLTIDGGGFGTYNLDSYLALTETNIRAINSSTLDASWGAAFVSTADSAAYARGGNVLRYTPTVTTEVINTLTGDDLERRAAVFVKVRNNSSTASYTIRGGVRQPSIDVWNQPVVVAPQAAARPETIYLGEVTFSPPSLIRIGITASATGAGTLDIETFYIVDLSSGESSIIRLGRDSGAVGVPGNRFITVNHNALTGLEPNVTVTTVTGVSNWTARGKLSVYTRSPNLQAVFLGTGSNTTLNTWRQVLTTTVIANDWTASSGLRMTGLT
jgi:hypothetical protein